MMGLAEDPTLPELNATDAATGLTGAQTRRLNEIGVNPAQLLSAWKQANPASAAGEFPGFVNEMFASIPETAMQQLAVASASSTGSEQGDWMKPVLILGGAALIVYLLTRKKRK